MEIHKNGLLIQEKVMNEKCGLCKENLYMQVYHHTGGLRRVISCKTCDTYTEIKKSKKYITDLKSLSNPSFLKKD